MANHPRSASSATSCTTSPPGGSSSRPGRSRAGVWHGPWASFAGAHCISTTPSHPSSTPRPSTPPRVPGLALGHDGTPENDGGRRLPQLPMNREQYDAFVEAVRGGRKVIPHALRAGQVLRGLPARRGDGRAGRRRAGLRADEAGRAARPRTGRRRTRWCSCAPRTATDRVQPGRLPDPAGVPRAAADLPDDPGLRAGRVPALRLDPPQLVRRVAALLAPTLELRVRPTCRLAGQITGVEGYIESTAMGLLAGRFAPPSSPAVASPAAARVGHGCLYQHVTRPRDRTSRSSR